MCENRMGSNRAGNGIMSGRVVKQQREGLGLAGNRFDRSVFNMPQLRSLAPKEPYQASSLEVSGHSLISWLSAKHPKK
jgi:hypothetical protein